MKYSLNKLNHVTFGKYEVGRLAPRAYFIPDASKKAKEASSFEHERFESSMVTLLSGKWDFKYYKSKSKLPDTVDTAKQSFDEVTVPSTWQRTGYEPPVYLNCPYGFTGTGVVPPQLPEDFSAGIYRKCFNIKDAGKTRILTFLGVDPCLDLYINGEFVGYGEGAHNSFEFDITKYLHEGENELVAVVFKWCCGSYLEAQDMFRENGIFRDVYITEYPETFINDYKLVTPKKGGKYSMNIGVELKGELEGCKLEAVLYDGKKTVAKSAVPASTDALLELKELDVTEWNAEEPYLYTLYITLYKGREQLMCVRVFAGFRTIEIKGNVFTFNGKKIKLKGVNHHDTHPVRGYAMTFEDLERDVKLMKEYNVNCVRTSHYPPDPQFIYFCDKYGLYVVDEADIETHGLPDLGLNIDTISMDLKWAPRYVDRVKRMYYRDRSHASIIMWSLGNEAEGYKCQDKCYEYLKQVCDFIPVHYEGVCRTKRAHYDVFSEMYTHPYEVNMVGEGTRDKKYKSVPFFLCEYCHAMGVGPGALEDYWDLFYEYDNLMGGCIWEWADHSVYHTKKEKNYKYEYTYGGDHGEKKHDGNFCVDGLFYPDRTPHTGALEMKAVYRPVRAKYAGGNKFAFTNTNRFRNASYLEIYWELLKNGELECCGSLSLDIPAEKTVKAAIDAGKLNKGDIYHMNFTYLDGDYIVATEQVALNDAKYVVPAPATGAIAVMTDSDGITVKFDGGSVAFCGDTGALVSYISGGKQYIAKDSGGIMPNMFRALTDNDIRMGDFWRRKGFVSLKYKLSELEAEVKSGSVTVEAEYGVYGTDGILYNCEFEWEIGADGVIKLTAELCEAEGCDEPVYDIPRFGIYFEMPRAFANAEYFGRGPAENLCDLKAQAPIGVYTSKVSDMHEDYIMPQDNGNHTQTRRLTLTDGAGKGLSVYSESGFTFNAHDYSQKLLDNAKHREDVKSEGGTFVTVDGFTRGIGTASCGPDTLDCYKINAAEKLVFSVTFAPVK